MAYKMDPTKKKNKNGGINAIVEGIKKGAEFLHPISGRFGALRKGKMIKNNLVNLKKKKAQLPSAQVSTDPTVVSAAAGAGMAKDKMKATPTAKDKMKATPTRGTMTKTLKAKRLPASSVKPAVKKATKDIQPSAKNANVKGTTLGNEKADGPNVTVYGKKKAKAAPKKVKVKIKNNKTKIKIKK